MSASTASGSANSRRRPAAASDMKERIDMNEDSSQLPNSNEKSPKPGWMTLLRYLLWFIVLVVLVRIIMEGRMARVDHWVDVQSRIFDVRLEKLNKRIGDLELRLNELKWKGLLTKDDASQNPFALLSYDELRHSVKDDLRTMSKDMVEIMANFSVEGSAIVPEAITLEHSC